MFKFYIEQFLFLEIKNRLHKGLENINKWQLYKSLGRGVGNVLRLISYPWLASQVGDGGFYESTWLGHGT